MEIREVLICDPTAYELAEIIAERFRAKLTYCKPINPNLIKRNGNLIEHLSQGSLFLWSNDYHQYATFFSDKKLVLVDNHTDMYNNTNRKIGRISCGSWAYWRLNLVGEVYLVVPCASLDPEDYTLPRGMEENFHLYSIKRSEGRISCLVDGWRSEICPQYCSKKVKDARKLTKDVNDSVQLSIDLDFMRHISDSDISKAMECVPQADTIDLWLDLKQNLEDQYKVCLDFLEKQSSDV